jgi:predicted N-acetyltransferase YhbS
MTKERGPADKIRKAESSDLEGIAKLLRTAGLYRRDDLIPRLEHMLGSTSGLCFVAERQGKVIGTILGNYNGFHVFLSHVAVDESASGRGIGGKLHQAFVEKATALGAMGIIADSWLTATGFFYKHSYRIPGAVFLIKDLI